MTSAPIAGSRQLNWACNHEYAFGEPVAPGSLDELRNVVASHRRLRVIGTRHSFNALADGERAVSVGRLPTEVVVDRSAMTVTCGAGLTYGELAGHLRPHGVALHNLASLPHISIAGAVATATHGSGDGNGNLATAVAAVELITASGDVVTVWRGMPEFDGCVVSLGALGVVTRLTLDVEPAFEIGQLVYEGLEWEALLDGFDEITSTGYSVSVFTGWAERAGSVWVKRRIGVGESWPATLAGAVPADGQRHPLPGLDPVNCTPQLGSPGPWEDRLPHFRMGFRPSNGEEIQSEYHVPRVHVREAALALLGVSAQVRPVLLVGEIRTVAADTLWLSPQYGRDTASFHFTWVRDQARVERALAAVESALEPFDPRPHWGKVFCYGPDTGRRFARLPEFLALRGHFDPSGRFANDWLDEHLLT